MFLRLRAQIRQIDIALAVAADNHDLQPRHRRTGGVGAVRRGWDQAHVTMLFATRLMPCPDHQQTGIFALRAGIRLQRYFGKSSCRAEPVFQPVDHGQIPCRLIRWREGMDIGETGQRDRDHLGGGVQLHRARPQRDHAAIERYVLVFQPFEIAQHLVFGVILIEGGLLQKPRTPQQFRGEGRNSARQAGT